MHPERQMKAAAQRPECKTIRNNWRNKECKVQSRNSQLADVLCVSNNQGIRNVKPAFGDPEERETYEQQDCQRVYRVPLTSGSKSHKDARGVQEQAALRCCDVQFERRGVRN